MASLEFVTKNYNSAVAKRDKVVQTLQNLKEAIPKRRSEMVKLGVQEKDIDNYINNPFNIPNTLSKRDKVFDKAYSVFDTINHRIPDNEKKLIEANNNVAKWEQMLQEVQEKTAERNIRVLLDFLEDWKKKTSEYYVSNVDNYINTRQEYMTVKKEYVLADLYGQVSEELRERYDSAKYKYENYSFLEPYMYRNELDTQKLNKDITNEANAKYDNIVSETRQIVGTITDASYLTIGMDGHINGIIIGTKGKASVRTGDAGGYNIQRYHFRTYIKEI